MTWIPHMRGSLKGKDKGTSPASSSTSPSTATAAASPQQAPTGPQRSSASSSSTPATASTAATSSSSSTAAAAAASAAVAASPMKLELGPRGSGGAASSLPTMSPAESPDSPDSLEIPRLERVASIPYEAGADDELSVAGPPVYYATEGSPSVRPNPKTGQVWVHLYHTDPYTAWLNWAGLKYAEVPIYHAGVEIYGIEWAFQYFDDAWDDDSVSGVVCCEPKSMSGFDYQESFCLGNTTLSSAEVRSLIGKLRPEWPANSYHLCRHNCLTFAKHLVEQLNVPEPFPAMLHGFGDAPRYIPVTDAIVDFGWSWYKWGMQRAAAAQREEEDDEVTEADADDFLAQQGSQAQRNFGRPPLGATASASQGSTARFIN